ncbi:hypothetical protein [Nitrosomonas sp. Is37]|uniref:hypothetical protein n=1 Tax=Nitrosomonas sp. Is37 TaxID=3080535 RepID=UPI00294B4BFB|nr:hypothetical protein [Nitrosomonas sp. Is37]MDV6343897.1 hypothetical protein [Nitrosomonas sp. Is37]
MIKIMVKVICLGMALVCLLSACSTTQKMTNSHRSATEQLLISEAVMRSLSKQPESALPIPQGANVKLDISGISPDKDFILAVVAGWLGEHGYTVQGSAENATYHINIVINSLGTELGNTFFGIPTVQASLIPLSLPELAIYKAEYQTGYANFYFDIFELPSNRFVGSSSPFIADTFYNAYTVLLVFTHKRTDLVSPLPLH